KTKFRLRTRLFYSNAQSVAARVVERNVFVLLEESHLTHALGGNAARRDVGYGSSGKLQPRMRNVDLVSQNRNANGLYFDHRFLDHRQQNVQVVDHQVINYVDVETSWREHAQSVNLEKQGTIQDWFHDTDSRIKTLDVTHLQNAFVFLRCLQKNVRL